MAPAVMEQVDHLHQVVLVLVVVADQVAVPVAPKVPLQIVQLLTEPPADCTVVVVVVVPLPLVVTAQVAAEAVPWLISITIQ